MKTKICILLAALSFSAATFAQKAKTMYIMKGNGVVFSTVVADIDSIIFYPPASIYDEGVIINGVKWATRNVDKPGTFTANPEDPGMFYEWDSKVGWSRSEPLTPSDGTSTWNDYYSRREKWEEYNDPCPPGWRMPNLGELETLVASGSVGKTVNHRDGFLFGSGSNTVFFPATGYRDESDGTLNYEDTSGFYWSSTVDSNINYAYSMPFTIGYAPSVNNYSRTGYGYACRCVAESN